MATHLDTIRLQLAGGPKTARQLAEHLGVSQPTLSRALSRMASEIVTIGAARSIQYALHDTARGLPDIPVYRVSAEGQLRQLGTLYPVRPGGFVMRQEDGTTLFSDGLPWWLFDMRPQGYLGRAYAARHGAALGLPERISDWNDTHILRALLEHGHDMTGNLLLGNTARDHYLAAPAPAAITPGQKPEAYAKFAHEAANGEIPGSSAGGEQPKFTTYAITSDGPHHVIVKFSEREENPVSERWRDLLLAEHLALTTLDEFGIHATHSQIIDHNNQRFLEAQRFDRVGNLGRLALYSLSALDAEFVGKADTDWPTIANQLANAKIITHEAASGAYLLWAFGTLIGNTDMHNGNLSFVAEHGRPYNLAPAYDMTPMGFSPSSGGRLRDTLTEAALSADVPNATWRQAEQLADAYVQRIRATHEFSPRFAPCITALEQHLTTASAKIRRLG